MSDRCAHMSFSAHVSVNRIEDKGRFAADVRIRCADCGLPFQFLGLEPGLDMNGARVSLDGLEARMAICPQGQVPSPMDGIAINIADDLRAVLVVERIAGRPDDDRAMLNRVLDARYWERHE